MSKIKHYGRVLIRPMECHYITKQPVTEGHFSFFITLEDRNLGETLYKYGNRCVRKMHTKLMQVFPESIFEVRGNGMKVTIVTTAKAREGDSYELAIGTKLCEAKAGIKIIKIVRYIASRLYWDFLKASLELSALEHYCNYIIAKEKMYLEKFRV